MSDMTLTIADLDLVEAAIKEKLGDNFSQENRIRKVLSLARQALQQEWRPISEAPRDGARVLICGGIYNCDPFHFEDRRFVRIVIAQYLPDHSPEKHLPWMGEQAGAHDWYCYHAPTHWMPLPAPPLIEGE